MTYRGNLAVSEGRVDAVQLQLVVDIGLLDLLIDGNVHGL